MALVKKGESIGIFSTGQLKRLQELHIPYQVKRVSQAPSVSLFGMSQDVLPPGQRRAIVFTQGKPLVALIREKKAAKK